MAYFRLADLTKKDRALTFKWYDHQHEESVSYYKGKGRQAMCEEMLQVFQDQKGTSPFYPERTKDDWLDFINIGEA